MHKSLYLLVLLTSLHVRVCDGNSLDGERHWYTGFSLLLGYSYKEVELEVENKDPSIPISGSLSDQGEYAPITLFESPYYYFFDDREHSFASQIGVFVNGGFSSFNLDRQKIGGGNTVNSYDPYYVDYGTSVKGRYLFAVPTVFIDFGDKQRKEGKGFAAKIGWGLGAAYLKAKGNIRLNGSDPGNELDIDINQLCMASGFLFELRYYNIAIRTYSVWPYIEDDPYIYNMSDGNLSLGYIYTFK